MGAANKFAGLFPFHKYMGHQNHYSNIQSAERRRASPNLTQSEGELSNY
jgi:hypothetical protein